MFEIKIGLTFALTLICFGWGIYLHRLDVPKKSTKIITWLIALTVLMLFLWNIDAFADEKIMHYDKDHNRTGYSVREGNRKSHFSNSGRRKGYSIYEGNRSDRFDNKWNRQGYDKYDESQNVKGDIDEYTALLDDSACGSDFFS